MTTFLFYYYILGWIGVASWYRNDGVGDWHPPLRGRKYPFSEFMYIFAWSPPFLALVLFVWVIGIQHETAETDGRIMRLRFLLLLLFISTVWIGILYYNVIKPDIEQHVSQEQKTR